jgi:hypothetical protein
VSTTPPSEIVVELLLIDGRPDGLCAVSIDNWNGTGLAFAKFDVSRAVKKAELRLPGIYVLQGPDPDDATSERIYIGEGNLVADRLSAHAGPRGKEFWTRAVAFTSEKLNKAHIVWLEAELIRLAQLSGRCVLDNETAPRPAPLSAIDQARVRTFLARTLMVMPFVGVTSFEGAQDERPSVGAVAVTLKTQDADGHGTYSARGLQVHEGSIARIAETQSAGSHVTTARKLLRDSGVLEERDGALVFTRDHIFDTPSEAAVALAGRNANGWTEWRLADGRFLKEYETE